MSYQVLSTTPIVKDPLILRQVHVAIKQLTQAGLFETAVSLAQSFDLPLHPIIADLAYVVVGLQLRHPNTGAFVMQDRASMVGWSRSSLTCRIKEILMLLLSVLLSLMIGPHDTSWQGCGGG